MSRFLETVDASYIGADIVREMINSLNVKFGGCAVSFMHLDLIEEKFPLADLMICRDLLFHLSFEDTVKVLRNFLASGIPYILTSTHVMDTRYSNIDIVSGEFRLIDLFAPPYNFPSNPFARIEDWVPPHPRRQLCLWSRDQVMKSIENWPIKF
jgi:hypothetical protein